MSSYNIKNYQEESGFRNSDNLMEDSKPLDSSILKTNEDIENNQSFLLYSFKERHYNPSRYQVKEKQIISNVNKSKQSLHKLENKVTKLDDQLSTLNIEESLEKKKKSQKLTPALPLLKGVSHSIEFKSKPLNKREADFVLFKEIFVLPKEKVLNKIKDKQKDAVQELQKIKHAIERKKHSLDASIRSSLPELDMEVSMLNKKEDLNIDQLLKEVEKEEENSKTSLKNFFDQQIQVQPPDRSISLAKTGEVIAPSLPLFTNLKESKSLIRDLLIKAKAGMQSGNIQKEAHLTYLIANIHENNKNYKQAIRFYKKYLNCAQLLEDKIGIALVANRLGVTLYNEGNYEKSNEMHTRNIELSDSENLFSGYYNLGINYRKLNKFELSLEYFQKALDWARIREELESECLSLGQCGITYSSMGLYDVASQYLSDCYEISRRIKNKRLQIDCLLNIIKISGLISEENADNILIILRDALECAKSINDHKIVTLCLCNMGVLEGKKKYRNLTASQVREQDDLFV